APPFLVHIRSDFFIPVQRLNCQTTVFWSDAYTCPNLARQASVLLHGLSFSTTESHFSMERYAAPSLSSYAPKIADYRAVLTFSAQMDDMFEANRSFSSYLRTDCERNRGCRTPLSHLWQNSSPSFNETSP